MTPTWRGEDPPAVPAPSALGWLRVVLRGGAIILAIMLGLPVLLLLRFGENLLAGGRRSISPQVTRIVCRIAVAVLGLHYRALGAAASRPAVIAANHSSWLDIFALNAGMAVTFVAKSEVAGWPGIGALARATGVLFIRRDRAEAAAQVSLIGARLGQGERLAFFPEGTSTDGQRVLPFKPALFAAFVAGGVAVQPVTIHWQAPAGADPRFYGWWGDMALGPHLLAILAAPRQGRLTVIRHPALNPADFNDRKALAAAAEAAVRAGFQPSAA